MEYTVEFDTINGGCFYSYYSNVEFDNLVGYVADELADCGGGHADIYYDGEFVEDVEV